jgi:hypothetical protein
MHPMDCLRNAFVVPFFFVRGHLRPSLSRCALPAQTHLRDRFFLAHATTAAVTTLLNVMVDPSTPASTKVRAADSVMSNAARAIEIEDIKARVSELERAASFGVQDRDPPHTNGGRETIHRSDSSAHCGNQGRGCLLEYGRGAAHRCATLKAVWARFDSFPRGP